jgi:hypothetical protein
MKAQERINFTATKEAISKATLARYRVTAGSNMDNCWLDLFELKIWDTVVMQLMIALLTSVLPGRAADRF